MLIFNKPICVLDIEATGLDPAVDRIVSLAILKLNPPDMFVEPRQWFDELFNPGFPMSKEVIAIHGITDEMVAVKPLFRERAYVVHDFIKTNDLVVFNGRNLDIPLLWEELYRAGIEWDLNGVSIIDAGLIFKKKEERTLTAALKFYCGKAMENAHQAKADTEATLEVLEGQLKRYQDLGNMGIAQLAEFSEQEKRVDLHGAIILDKDGDYAYTHKRVRGVKVKDDPGYAEWMLSKDFPHNTKIVLRKILSELEQTEEPIDE